MRRGLVLSLVLSATLVLGCSLLKKKRPAADEDESVTNAPTVSVGGTGAKNEKDILRYANETKIFDEPAIIGRDGVKAKTFPSTGADIATIPKGSTVIKKAKFFSTSILVTFDDPTTNDGTKLMGWIVPEALGPPPVATATATAAPVFTGAKVAPKDAGLPVDAGKPAAIDAGGGGGAAAPTALLQVVPAPGNRCPAGFALFPPFCRRPCNADKDCPPNAICTQGSFSRKTCAATR